MEHLLCARHERSTPFSTYYLTLTQTCNVGMSAVYIGKAEVWGDALVL